MGKKKSANKHARVAVYVPQELAKRLDKYSGQINFSRVACAALEREVELIESLKNIEDEGRKAMLERLRKSKQEDTEGMLDHGKTEGTDWATNHAEYRELLNASNFLEETQRTVGPVSCYLDGLNATPLSPSEVVYSAIFDVEDSTLDCRDVDEFFGEIVGISESTRNDPHFLEGFIDGIVGVWESAKDEV